MFYATEIGNVDVHFNRQSKEMEAMSRTQPTKLPQDFPGDPAKSLAEILRSKSAASTAGNTNAQEETLHSDSSDEFARALEEASMMKFDEPQRSPLNDDDERAPGEPRQTFDATSGKPPDAGQPPDELIVQGEELQNGTNNETRKMEQGPQGPSPEQLPLPRMWMIEKIEFVPTMRPAEGDEYTVSASKSSSEDCVAFKAKLDEIKRLLRTFLDAPPSASEGGLVGLRGAFAALASRRPPPCVADEDLRRFHATRKKVELLWKAVQQRNENQMRLQKAEIEIERMRYELVNFKSKEGRPLTGRAREAFRLPDKTRIFESIGARQTRARDPRKS
jgi:hypothetical protein